MSCTGTTLSWFARRMLRLDRLVRRLGTATAYSFDQTQLRRLVPERQQRREPRVDVLLFGRSLDVGSGGGGHTRAVVRAQGNHGDPEQELVPDEVVEHDGLAVVGQGVGLGVLERVLDLALVLGVLDLRRRARRCTLISEWTSMSTGSRQRAQGTFTGASSVPWTTTSGPLFEARTSSYAVPGGGRRLVVLEHAADPRRADRRSGSPFRRRRARCVLIVNSCALIAGEAPFRRSRAKRKPGHAALGAGIPLASMTRSTT